MKTRITYISRVSKAVLGIMDNAGFVPRAGDHIKLDGKEWIVHGILLDADNSIGYTEVEVFVNKVTSNIVSYM